MFIYNYNVIAYSIPDVMYSYSHKSIMGNRNVRNDCFMAQERYPYDCFTELRADVQLKL